MKELIENVEELMALGKEMTEIAEILGLDYRLAQEVMDFVTETADVD